MFSVCSRSRCAGLFSEAFGDDTDGGKGAGKGGYDGDHLHEERRALPTDEDLLNSLADMSAQLQVLGERMQQFQRIMEEAVQV